MIQLTIYRLIIILITITIVLFPLFFIKLTKKWSEKFITFECGINLNSIPRKPFSLRFFLLIVLFIIFDIEIALILIMPLIQSWSIQIIIFLNIFFVILSIGIIYEWNEGSLNWKL